MKNKILLALVLLACLLSVGFQVRPSHRWEYKVENGVAEGKLNMLAVEGWEVIAAGSYNGGMPYVILKRPK